MVKDAVTRKRRYDAGLQPDVIGKRFDQVAPVMRELEAEYFGQIADVEAKVKQACEAVGVPGFLVGQYVNVGRECYSVAKRFTQATRDLEAQRVVDKWASRGLDGPLLVLACRAGGCETEAPPPICYPPCVHNIAALHTGHLTDELHGPLVARHIRYWRYLNPLNVWGTVADSGFAITQVGTAWLMPIEVPFKCVADGIVCYTWDPAVGHQRAGLYGPDGGAERPDGLPLVAETISLANPGTYRRWTMPMPETTLEPGLYWVGLMGDEGTSRFAYISYSRIYDWSGVTGNLNSAAYNRPGGYGAFLNPCPVTWAIGTWSGNFLLQLRVKEIFEP